MKHITALAALLLSACGGGGIGDIAAGPVTINVTVEAGAITCNNCSVTLGPAGAASAPLPAASAPSPSASQPAPNVPLGSMVTKTSEYSATAGNLYWLSGGIGYQIRVATAFDFVFVSVFSTSNPLAQSPTWQVETTLDDGLDLHVPAGNDAALRAYLTAYVLPNLNAWLAANSGRFAGGMTFEPVSTAEPPLALGALQRLAARLPQWVQVTPTGAMLKP